MSASVGNRYKPKENQHNSERFLGDPCFCFLPEHGSYKLKVLAKRRVLLAQRFKFLVLFVLWTKLLWLWVYLLGIYIDFGISPNSELKKMLYITAASPEDLKVGLRTYWKGSESGLNYRQAPLPGDTQTKVVPKGIIGRASLWWFLKAKTCYMCRVPLVASLRM